MPAAAVMAAVERAAAATVAAARAVALVVAGMGVGVERDQASVETEAVAAERPPLNHLVDG